MIPEFAASLRALARLIVRVGLNLQPGQRLLIAEPYELQGVARGAEVLVEAVKVAALLAGACDVTVVWGEGGRLRQYVEKKDWRGFRREIGANTRLLQEYVRKGDALLFLQSSHLDLMHGLAPAAVNEFRHLVWEHFGPVAQELTAGATNWTVASAPIPTWAHAVYTDLPADRRLGALWTDLFAAMRVDRPDPVAAWQAHLQELRLEAAELNVRATKALRYLGAGTDLTVELPPEHVWCTACLTTKSGLPFVANLPTEELFTTPHKDSADGLAVVSRPINYGGTVIDGIQLEFKRGRVIGCRARSGEDLLRRLLETDEGASHLGEVALVPRETALGRSGRLYFNPLLDENATSHIALGEGYAFCLRSPNPAALNRSLIHVDLPLDSRPMAIPAQTG
jgi:aminopeptidase